MDKRECYGRRYSDRNAGWIVIGYRVVAIIYFILGFTFGRWSA